MLTFLELGKYGRFGNQLFQIAATIGIARANNHNFVFPVWENAPLFRNPLPQESAFRSPDLIIHQDWFGYRPISVPADDRVLVSLHGYFQSERFFLNCPELVRSTFCPSESIERHLSGAYGKVLRSAPSCAVYVRRGDYALFPMHHPMQPREYYTSAMEMFAKDTIFFVSSDDIPWCEDNLNCRRCVFLREEGFATSFFLGTLCQNLIISNSTFGWWAAWLNTAKEQVIAPKAWFGPAYSHLNTNDLIPGTWTTL